MNIEEKVEELEEELEEVRDLNKDLSEQVEELIKDNERLQKQVYGYQDIIKYLIEKHEVIE